MKKYRLIKKDPDGNTKVLSRKMTLDEANRKLYRWLKEDAAGNPAIKGGVLIRLCWPLARRLWRQGAGTFDGRRWYRHDYCIYSVEECHG